MFEDYGLLGSYVAELLVVALFLLGLTTAAGRTRLYLVGLPVFWGAGAWLTYLAQSGGVSLPVCLAVAVMALLIGAALQIPLPRVREDVVILVGLTLLEILRRAMQGVLGPQGESGLWQPTFFEFGPDWSASALAAVCLLGAIGVLVLTGLGRWRLLWGALEEGEPSLVASAGLEPSRLRYLNTVLVCTFGMLAGVLSTFLQGSVNPMDLDIDRAVMLFALIFLGGLSPVGAFIGALLFVAVPVLLREFQVAESELEALLWRNLIFAVVLIATVSLAPSGLTGPPFKFDVEGTQRDV